MTKPSKFAQPFSGFEILDRLGSGGMGTVFKARRKSDGLVVAVKVLRPSLSRNSRYVERLRREAEISMRLDHPGLVKGFGLGEEGGYHYLVMEFVEGRSLKALLKTWGRFPEEQVLEVGMQIAESLRYAHEHGVIHRDVKPGNILVDEEDRAKLTDLGLAKGESDPTLTRDGATVGTPQYMSPEQAQDPSNVDERSDLYSLGATLYHMAVGLPPFEGESVVQVISKLLHERADSAGSLNPEVSTGVNLILRRLLAKDPALRYQTAVDLLVDLGKVQKGQSPSVDVKALTKAEDRLTGKTSGVSRLWIGVAAAVLISFLTWLVLRDPSDGNGPPTGIDGLRSAVADARRGFRTRLQLIESFRPTEGERLEVVQLRQSVLREFENAMDSFQKDVGTGKLRQWIDARGLEKRSGDLDVWLQAQLQGHDKFRGYTPRSLPAEVRERYEQWRKARQREYARWIDDRCEAAAGEVRRAFHEATLPSLRKMRAERRFEGAENLATRLIERPWTCAATDGSTTRLPASERRRLDDIVLELRTEREAMREEAQRIVERWRGAIVSLLSDAGRSAEAGVTKRAALRLEAAETALRQTPKPWRTLPAQVDPGIDELGGRIVAIRARIEDANRRRDFAALRECEDAIHAVLRRSCNVEEAKRLLASYDFADPDAEAAKKGLADDLSLLESAVAWLLRQVVASQSRKWPLANERVEATVVGEASRTPPAVELKIGGARKRVLLAAFDRAALVRLLASSSPPEEHRIGIGLFVFFGDQFTEAPRHLRNHRGDRYRALRDRRKIWLDQLGHQTETQASRLLESVRGLLPRSGRDFAHLELAASKLRQLEEDYAATDAVRTNAGEIRRFHVRIETERQRRALVARLDPKLRDLIDVDLYREGDDARVRATISLVASDVAKLDTAWRRQRSGVSPPATNGETPVVELDALLRLPIAFVEPIAAATITVHLRIPSDGRPLDLLRLGLFGGRLVLVQLPGRSAVALEGTGNLKAIIARSHRFAEEKPDWFLMRGARYVLKVELGPVQNQRRSCRVFLNGVHVNTQRASLKTVRPKPEIEVQAVGDVTLEKIRVETTSRQ